MSFADRMKKFEKEQSTEPSIVYNAALAVQHYVETGADKALDGAAYTAVVLKPTVMPFVKGYRSFMNGLADVAEKQAAKNAAAKK